MLKKNKKIIAISGGVVLILLIILISTRNKPADKELIVKVQRGPFKITVTTTGELEAKHSEKILGPDGLNEVGI